MKQIALQDLGPLPLRAIPRPWEDLASLVSRVARKMGYEQPAWILGPENSSYRIAPKSLAYLSRVADYALLEQLLLLDEETLYALTLHCFVPLLGAAPFPVGQRPPEIMRPQLADRQEIFWPALETQICPLCLEEHGYDRLYWRVRALLICPQHATYLQHRCPACFKPVPSLRRDLFMCPYCHGGDYRSTCEPIHPRDSWLFDAQVLLLERLGVDLSLWGSSAHSTSPLRQLHPRHYFLLMQKFEDLFVHESFVTVVLRDLFQQPALHSLGPLPGERKSAFLFHWVVAQWPDHFFWLQQRIASLFPEEVYWGKGWSRWPVLWRDLDFFLNPAFAAPDQQRTIPLLLGFFQAYEIYFYSRPGTF